MCAGAILMSRLDRVVYGVADPEKGCCGSVYDLPADPAFAAGIRWRAGESAAACESLLSSFFQRRRACPEGGLPGAGDKPQGAEEP